MDIATPINYLLRWPRRIKLRPGRVMYRVNHAPLGALHNYRKSVCVCLTTRQAGWVFTRSENLTDYMLSQWPWHWEEDEEEEEEAVAVR